MAGILEHGDIYFLYWPRPDTSATGLYGVRRFYMVLHPHDHAIYRLLAIGEERLPALGEGTDSAWLRVDKVGRRAEEITGELAYQEHHAQAGFTRAVGEGVYALVRHQDHAHLLYALELPEEPGDVQKDLNIAKEASYVISVKNPLLPSPPAPGQEEGYVSRDEGIFPQSLHGPESEIPFPSHLQQRFQGKRFLSVDDPQFLDHEGTELLLIGLEANIPQELGVTLQPEHETLETAEIFQDLHLRCAECSAEPLFRGEWP